MKITKYAQSCIVIELKDKRILIDPGNYVFEKMKPEDFKHINILLITHRHADHCFIDALKIISKNSNPTILTNKETNGLLKENGINSEILEVDETKQIDGISIKAIKGKHGIPPDKIIPEDIGFLINDKIYHPGDTVNFDDKPYAEIVFVPIAGPELSIETAVQFVEDIKCKIAIPIHYDSPRFPADPKDFLNKMKNSVIKVQILNNGESIDMK